MSLSIAFRLFGLVLIISALEVTSEKNRLNVVLVLFDDLRPVLSGYGNDLAKTPNLDRFMKKSFHFTKAYCQQALCAPSRNSLLTSRRPDSLRLYDFYSYWRDSVGNFTTLPQYFKENGYETYSIGKVFHPGKSSNFSDDYPLSWTYPSFHPITERYLNSPVCPDGSGTYKANIICPVRLDSVPEETLPDIESFFAAKTFLQNRVSTGDPFFLAVGFHKPHIPLMFPKRFVNWFPNQSEFNDEGSYKPNDMPMVAWNPFTDLRKRNDVKQLNVSFPFGPIPSDFRSSIRQAYYMTVSYVDDLFGKLMDTINFDNTVVVVTSDHGWSLGEHGEWAKYSNFEIALRVPLIIYSPQYKLSQGKEIDSVVELVDIFPTIVDLAKLPRVPNCGKHFAQTKILCTEGKSLFSLINCGRDFNHRFAYSQYPRPGDYPTKFPNSDKPKLNQIQVMGYSLRTSDFRYTLWIKFNPQNFTRDWSQVYGEELYDHRVDPQENMNLEGREGFENIRKKLRHILVEQFLSVDDIYAS